MSGAIRPIAAVIAGLALAIAIVACGGASRKPTMAPAGPEAGAMPMPATGTPREQITRLDADIKANLDRLQLPEVAPWDAASGTTPDPRPMAEIRDVCTTPPRPSETCTDVCGLGTQICDNADKICELAADLQPDAWATGKCDDGKKSCEAARKRCCDCN